MVKRAQLYSNPDAAYNVEVFDWVHWTSRSFWKLGHSHPYDVVCTSCFSRRPLWG